MFRGRESGSSHWRTTRIAEYLELTEGQIDEWKTIQDGAQETADATTKLMQDYAKKYNMVIVVPI